MPRKLKTTAAPPLDEEFAPLSRSQMRELRRRIRDIDDPIRYVIASAFTPRFVLYFDVTSGSFAMNDVSGGTLFKRRAHAAAVAALLGDGLQIVKVRVGLRGSLKVLSRIKPRVPRRHSRRGQKPQSDARKRA